VFGLKGRGAGATLLVALSGCGHPAPVAEVGFDLSRFEGAWPRPARRSGVCAGPSGLEITRGKSPTRFALVDRTRDSERDYAILSAVSDDQGIVRLAVQREGRPERHLQVAIDEAHKVAVVTWLGPPGPSFSLVPPRDARFQPVKPCP
jgi:hypothetical protein